MQYHIGELTELKDKKWPKVFTETIYTYHKYNMSYKIHQEIHKDSKDLFKWYYLWIPLKDSWEEIIVNGNIDRSFLENKMRIDLKGFKPDEQDNLRYILENWENMGHEAFKEKFKKLKIDLAAGKYTSIEDLISIYDFIDFLNKNNTVRDKPITLMKSAKKYKDKLTSNENPYNGIIFHDEETDEYKNVKKELQSIATLNEMNKRAYLLNQKMENFEQFLLDLARGFKYISGYEQYHIPILKYIDKEKFLNGLKHLNIYTISEFIDSLAIRYSLEEKMEIESSYLLEEIELLKQLEKVLVIRKSERTLLNPIMIRKKQIYAKYLEIIEYLEKKKLEFSN